MKSQLEALLQHPGVWLAAGSQHSDVAAISTGFKEVDKEVRGQGWPAHGVIELLMDRCGSGELSLFLPALARICAAGAGADSTTRWMAWINPPHEPYAPALALHGLDVSRMVIARTAEPLWAIEQALRSASCRVVLGWIEAANIKALRRLQLATEHSAALCLLFRPSRFSRQASPACLRMMLRSMNGCTELELIKVRGQRPSVVRVDLDNHSSLAVQ